MKKTALYVTLGVIALFVVIVFFMNLTYDNNKIDKRNLVTTQQEKCKANFDKMYKVIQQTAEVAQAKFEVSKEAYKEIYPALIEGRYDKGDGTLMKWITESNPTFDIKEAASLYDKLATAIESNRQEFFAEQTKLLDYNREYKTYISKAPARWFVNESDTLTLTIITSKVTKEVYSTGEENDINLLKD
jgi:hypothetical protein